MKLFFFLVALCLVLLRAYFGIVSHGHPTDRNNGTVTVSIGDYEEQVKWSGKIEFDEDEKSIKSIPPGGYLKFRENDARLTAESNMNGVINYQLYDGSHTLALDDSGKQFISACIKTMIAWGFNADGRAANINKKAGYRGLLEALPSLKMENSKAPYIDLLLTNDSLRGNELSTVIRQLSNGMADVSKEEFLKRITAAQLKDSLVANAYLDIISTINADIQKVNLFLGVAEKDSVTPFMFNRIVGIAGHFNADIDKRTVYEKLVDLPTLAEQQWILLIDASAGQHNDIDKSDFLMRIAQKMPHTDNLKAAYLAAAKKINDDAAYGRAVKVIN